MLFFANKRDLLCAFFLLVSGPVTRVDGVFKEAATMFGASILDQQVSLLSDLAVDYALEEVFGYVQPDPFDQLSLEIAALRESVQEISDQITELEKLERETQYIVANTKAVEVVGAIETATAQMSRWVTVGYKPDTMSITTQKEKLTWALANFDTISGDLGVIALFMRRGSLYTPVSNQYKYHQDLEEMRVYYRNALAMAVVGYETLAQYLHDLNESGCRRKLESDSDEQRGPVALRGSNEPQARELYIDIVTTYEGATNTACRHNVAGDGGPADPIVKANDKDNKYFNVVTKSTMFACQDECTRHSACVGVEYGTSQSRCELWKMTIGHFKSPSSGYACFKKIVTQTDIKQNCNLPLISNDELNHFFQQAKKLGRDLYVSGVPLLENRNGAKFVHVRGEPWALSPPTDFSGYFATATADRLGTKLQTMASLYDANAHAQTLQKFLEANGIPTNYVDQSSWSCIKAGGIALQGDTNVPAFVGVTLLRIVGNAYQSESYYLEEGYADECGSIIDSKKNAAAHGSLHIGTAYKRACTDSDLCDGLHMSDPVSLNTGFHGRFFTYNLKSDDCVRMCEGDKEWSKGCYYCGKGTGRLDDSGRPMLFSETAITDFVGY